MRYDFHSYLPEEVLGARLHRAVLERKAERAAIMMRDFCAEHTVSLALSFGKDSMTLLHIVSRFGLLGSFAMVLWNNSGVETDDTIALRDYVLEKYNLGPLFVETCPDEDTLRDSLASADFNAAHPVRDFVYRCLELPRWAAMDSRQVDGTVFGLRADESHGRKISARCRGQWYHNKREQADMLTPLSWWSTADVLEYAALEHIPLHPVYTQKMRYGFERAAIRHNTPVDVSFFRSGDLLYLKREHPSAYAKIRDLIPGITLL